MAIKLSEKDQRQLDKLLKTILTWHADGDVTTQEAIGALAHVFTAAAIDNGGEVDSWLNKPGTLANWKGIADASRP